MLAVIWQALLPYPPQLASKKKQAAGEPNLGHRMPPATSSIFLCITD